MKTTLYEPRHIPNPFYPIIWTLKKSSDITSEMISKVQKTLYITKRTVSNTCQAVQTKKNNTKHKVNVVCCACTHRIHKVHTKTVNGVDSAAFFIKDKAWPLARPIVFLQPECYFEFIVYQMAVKRVFAFMPSFFGNVIVEHTSLAIVAFSTACFGSPFFMIFHAAGLSKELYLALASAILVREICHLSSRDRLSKAQQHVCFFGIDFFLSHYALFVGILTALPMDIVGSLLQPICTAIKTSKMPIDVKDIEISELRKKISLIQNEYENFKAEISKKFDKLSEENRKLHDEQHEENRKLHDEQHEENRKLHDEQHEENRKLENKIAAIPEQMGRAILGNSFMDQFTNSFILSIKQQLTGQSEFAQGRLPASGQSRLLTEGSTIVINGESYLCPSDTTIVFNKEALHPLLQILPSPPSFFQPLALLSSEETSDKIGTRKIQEIK